MKTKAKIIALLLFAITMATVLSSCSKESSYDKKIEGKWVLTRAVCSLYDTTGSLVSIEEGQTVVGFVYDFQADGTVIIGGMRELPYSIDGDVLTIEGYGALEEIRIVEMTNSSMAWKSEIVLDGNNSIYPPHYGYKQVMDMELEKK